MTEALTVDDLTFEVRRSSRRDTIELIVDRGGELIIAAPEGLETEAMAGFVREKRFWLYTKLAAKEALQHEVPAKEFVDGEGFPYLGRSHRLLLVDEKGTTLKLTNGRFRLRRDAAGNGRAHFIAWYTKHARSWLEPRIEAAAKRVGVRPPCFEVRDLGFRWGSCSQSGILNFHWAMILLPPSIIEYVLVHELVHIHESNHTPEFWTRVERAMPDYQARKQWLAQHGAAVVAL